MTMEAHKDARTAQEQNASNKYWLPRHKNNNIQSVLWQHYFKLLQDNVLNYYIVGLWNGKKKMVWLNNNIHECKRKVHSAANPHSENGKVQKLEKLNK